VLDRSTERAPKCDQQYVGELLGRLQVTEGFQV